MMGCQRFVVFEKERCGIEDSEMDNGIRRIQKLKTGVERNRKVSYEQRSSSPSNSSLRPCTPCT